MASKQQGESPSQPPNKEALDEAYYQGRAYECMKWECRVNGLTAERDQYRAMYQSLLTRVANGVAMMPRETFVLQANPAPNQPVLQERERINDLLRAIREHWVKANGEDSLSVGALDQIAEVIADGSYVAAAAKTPSAPSNGPTTNLRTPWLAPE